MFAKWWKKDKAEKSVDVPMDVAEMDWSFLGADMHSHLIPGIDDGAKTVEESLALLAALQEMGFRKVVTTPHIMIDHYPNTAAGIKEGLSVLKEHVATAGLTIEVEAAAEYFIDEYFMELLDKEPLLTVTGNQVLVEFSMMMEPRLLNQALFNMQVAGYKPIIAHPERYNFYHNNYQRFAEFKERGCLLQLNLLSLTGHYGRSVTATAMRLLNDKMYDYCGTDMHHERHAGGIKKMLQTKAPADLSAQSFLNSKLCF